MGTCGEDKEAVLGMAVFDTLRELFASGAGAYAAARFDAVNEAELNSDRSDHRLYGVDFWMRSLRDALLQLRPVNAFLEDFSMFTMMKR